MISETQECLVLVISGYSFIIYFSVKFGFVGHHVCTFAIIFTTFVNIFQIKGFLVKLILNERGWMVIHKGNLTNDHQILSVYC